MFLSAKQILQLMFFVSIIKASEHKLVRIMKVLETKAVRA